VITVVTILAVVAVIAVVIRAMSSGGVSDATTASTSPEPSSAVVLGEDADDRGEEGYDDDFAEGDMVEAVAVTSEGTAFVPHRGGVELIPPGEDEDELREAAERHGLQSIAQAASSAPRNPKTGRLVVQWRPGQSLTAGDVVAVRVVRGAPDFDPWRLECLGRDRDYRPFAFETEQAARTAAELIVMRILRPPRDQDGDPIPVGAEDFMVARRQWEETEAALAMDDDPEDDPLR
jgi:hypothetical protein